MYPKDFAELDAIIPSKEYKLPSQRKIVLRNTKALDYYESYQKDKLHDDWCDIHFGGYCDCKET